MSHPEPKSEGYQFSLWLNVNDVAELYQAAYDERAENA